MGSPHIMVGENEPPVSKLVCFHCGCLNLFPVGEHVEPASNDELQNGSTPVRRNGLQKADKSLLETIPSSDLMFLSKTLNIQTTAQCAKVGMEELHWPLLSHE